MLKRSEQIMLCNAIREMTNQDFSEAGEQLFAASLDQLMGVQDALACLAEWNAQAHDFHQVSAGDLNAIWKSYRPSSRLSEAEIGRMLEPLDLTDDEQWAARRALIANANAGMSREQALAKALESARGHLLPAAPPKPKPTNNHHFAGRLRLGDVVGNQEGKTL
jgi:hypothetical protein